MLALSTSFAPPAWTLDRAVAAMRSLRVRSIALHRAPEAGEASALAAFAGRLDIVALFADGPAEGVGRPVLVVEGGPAGPDREASLEELCRRLHPLRGHRVALRTPPSDDHHPSAAELALVHGAVSHAGYWHDASRGGAAHLDAAGRLLRGLSFRPLERDDLVHLRDALGGGAPAVVACRPDTPREEVEESLRRARGVFGD